MSKQIDITDSISNNLVSYDDGYSAYSVSNLSNAFAGSSNTTYAQINLTRGANAVTQIYYNFDSFDIPSGATINSVTCTCKCLINTTNSSRISTRQAQLYSGTTAMGRAYTVASNTNAFNITAGSWTASQLNNGVKLRLYVVRGTSNATSSYYLRLYGSTLTVSYSYHGVVYEVTASSEYAGATISPATQDIIPGDSCTVEIRTDDLSAITVEDNGTDVTGDLQYVAQTDTTPTTVTIDASIYDDESSSYYRTYNNSSDSAVDGVYNGNVPSNGATGASSTTRACVFSNTGNGATSYLVYKFDVSNIPSDAIISSVSCSVKASYYSSNSMISGHVAQLYTGTTAKGTSTSITGTGSTSSTQTVDGGSSWTRSELNDINIKYTITRSSSNTTSAASFSFWGATLTVTYTLPQQPYYEYTATNVMADHNIVVTESVFIPPEEDPQKTYYNLTISSINSTTEPSRGTTRVESGSNNTITIYPSDPLVTLITDNGVDVSNQLVAHGGTIQTPTVTTASGASYGFSLNSSTGYYVSQNTGVDKSAAVCVVNFNLPVRCLVTIQYINYAEETYDFGIFGNIDAPLTNDYKPASGSMPDSNYKLACNTSTYNTSSAQTITYEMPSGEHQIYIKYTKDDATSSYNDNLQWKIISIEPLETNNYYTYTLSNVSQDHSLIFIFGNVSYYFVNSSTTGNCVLNPNGQMVQLPGDTYKLTIVPENNEDIITITDNGTDVTSLLEEKEVTIEKEGVTTTVINYIYKLTNIQATHNLIVYSASGGRNAYVKDDEWVETVDILKKSNNSWGSVKYTRIWIHNGTTWVEDAQRTISAKGITVIL